MTEDLKTHIENLKKTTAAKERIESELQIAHDIQMGFLHRDFPPYPDRSEFNIFATIEPAKEVGGDLYDFFFVDDDHLCFSIGDVSGKGVPAALFMAIAKTLVKTKTTEGVLPHQVLQSVNADLLINNEASMFVTIILGILNLKSGNLVYCNAGHNYPYIIDARGNVRQLQTINGLPLGIMDAFQWESGQAELNNGDTLFLYTDGITEAMDGKDEEFSEERLEKDLTRLHNKPIQEVAHGVAESVKSYAKDVPQSDDITMLILEFNGL